MKDCKLVEKEREGMGSGGGLKERGTKKADERDVEKERKGMVAKVVEKFEALEKSDAAEEFECNGGG